MRSKKPLKNPWHLLGAFAIRAIQPLFAGLFAAISGSAVIAMGLVAWNIIPIEAFLIAFTISMVAFWFIGYRLDQWESRPRPADPPDDSSATEK